MSSSHSTTWLPSYLLRCLWPSANTFGATSSSPVLCSNRSSQFISTRPFGHSHQGSGTEGNVGSVGRKEDCLWSKEEVGGCGSWRGGSGERGSGQVSEKPWQGSMGAVGGACWKGLPQHFGSLSPSAKADSQTRPRSWAHQSQRLGPNCYQTLATEKSFFTVMGRVPINWRCQMWSTTMSFAKRSWLRSKGRPRGWSHTIQRCTSTTYLMANRLW